MGNNNHPVTSDGLQLFVANLPLVDQLTASRLNAMIYAISTNRLLNGRGYRRREFGRGVGFSLDISPGNRGGSGMAQEPDPPFTVLKAPVQGAPGRVRVLAGLLAGLLPAQMKLPDRKLPNDGNDNRCYLTVQPGGSNYVLGQVKLSPQTGAFSTAAVVLSQSPTGSDPNSVYLTLAQVSYTQAEGLSIFQGTDGNQGVLVTVGSDDSLNPIWYKV